MRPVSQPRRRPRCAELGGRSFESCLRSPRGGVPTSERSGLNVPGRVAGSPVRADCGSKPRRHRPGPRGHSRTGQGCIKSRSLSSAPRPARREPGARRGRRPGAAPGVVAAAPAAGVGPPGHRPRRPGARRSQWRPRRRAGIGAGSGWAGGAGRGEEARRALSARL